MPQRDAPDGTPLTLGEEPAYCPTCGAPVRPQLLEDDHRPRLVCPNGHVTWRNPRLVVGTLPVRAGRVFLARRSIEPGAGLWTYPGGFLEVGESAQEGARRETEEETQLWVEVGRLIGAYSRPHVGVVTLVFNKIDLAAGLPVADTISGPPRLHVSAATGAGLDLLRAHLKDSVSFQTAGNGSISARRRHLEALALARDCVETAARKLEEHRAGELIAEDLRQGQKALEEITGIFTADDLLGRIFGSFCIGK